MTKATDLQASEALKIEHWPAVKLTGYARNPRKNDPAVDRMCASIREFGFAVPILVKGDGEVIDGHLRLKAARKLEIAHLPVIVCDGWTDAQVKAFRILANRSVNWAEWDIELLAVEMGELEALDFDISLIGFADGELSAILPRQIPSAGLTDADDCPEVAEKPVSGPGDIWLLGRHRLACGDSTSRADFERLMLAEKADLVITDPPYNINYEGKTKAKLKIKNDNMDNERFTQFLRDAYSMIGLFSKDGASVYVFHADSLGHLFRRQFLETGFHLSGVCIWKKQTIVIGRSDFHWKHEPILYGWKEGASHSWYGDRKQSTIWEFDRPTKSDLHPTMKPVAMLEYPIGLSSKSGDVVLDPFGGSGSTLIACEQTGRSARLMELDPRYVDVIVQRWQAFSGKLATLEADGRTFADVSAERKPAAAQ